MPESGPSGPGREKARLLRARSWRELRFALVLSPRREKGFFGGAFPHRFV